jgi:hypothetical protein
VRSLTCCLVGGLKFCSCEGSVGNRQHGCLVVEVRVCQTGWQAVAASETRISEELYLQGL